MSFLDRFRRKKEDEAARFARLSKTGRITEGSVLDIKSDDQDRITHVFYTYNIAGVCSTTRAGRIPALGLTTG